MESRSRQLQRHVDRRPVGRRRALRRPQSRHDRDGRRASRPSASAMFVDAARQRGAAASRSSRWRTSCRRAWSARSSRSRRRRFSSPTTAARSTCRAASVALDVNKHLTHDPTCGAMQWFHPFCRRWMSRTMGVAEPASVHRLVARHQVERPEQALGVLRDVHATEVAAGTSDARRHSLFFFVSSRFRGCIHPQWISPTKSR